MSIPMRECVYYISYIWMMTTYLESSGVSSLSLLKPWPVCVLDFVPIPSISGMAARQHRTPLLCFYMSVCVYACVICACACN